MHCIRYRWKGDNLYGKPTKDEDQNMQNATLTFANDMLTLTFKRARNTGDKRDLAFTDKDCYHFIFPVGGGSHTDNGIERHTNEPITSPNKICITNSSKFRVHHSTRLYFTQGRAYTF